MVSVISKYSVAVRGTTSAALLAITYHIPVTVVNIGKPQKMPQRLFFQGNGLSVAIPELPSLSFPFGVVVMYVQVVLVACLILVFLLATAAQFTERTDTVALLYGLMFAVIGVVGYISL